MIKALIGQGFALNGRDAVTEAIHAALRQLDGQQLALAIILASDEYAIEEVLAGSITQLGNTPLIGFSVSSELSQIGAHRRSVLVGLITGDGLEARAEWLPGFTESGQRTAQSMIDALQLNGAANDILLLMADGLSAEAETLCETLSTAGYLAAGCLAGGNLKQGRTFQIGGEQAGSGGLAAAVLRGKSLRLGVGTAHGWQPVGAHFKITGAQGAWVRTLNDKPASESYAQLFGRNAHEWSFPPLNTLVRLYPLGIETPGNNGTLTVRTPLRVEADGSLRMNAAIEDGAIGHLLVGSAERCIQAAQQAAQQALDDLNGASPRLAMIFVDASWEMLLKGQPGAEVKAVSQIIGTDVPIMGGYTFGQIAPNTAANQIQFLNQHIEVALLGEA